MADRDSRVFQLEGVMSANGPLSDVQASAYGEKADFITCDITPTSDSFSFREPTAQEAASHPSKTNSLSEALLSIPEFHSIANAWKHDFYSSLRK
jgi:hypothetical protein